MASIDFPLSLMSYLDKLFTFIVGNKREEDVFDRLNYRVTSIMLVTAAAAIFTKEYGGNPIQCYTMAEWRKGWIEYAHDICMVEDTYYLPMDQMKIPKNEESKKDMQIFYYQVISYQAYKINFSGYHLF